MAVLVLLNNFLHDFSAAGWLFGSVLLWVIFKKKSLQLNTDKNVVEIIKTLLFLMNVSVFGIITFGLVRAFAYKTYEWNTAAGQAQITLLVVKHVIFAVIFVFGLLCYLKARKWVKKASYEK